MLALGAASWILNIHLSLLVFEAHRGLFFGKQLERGAARCCERVPLIYELLCSRRKDRPSNSRQYCCKCFDAASAASVFRVNRAPTGC